MKIRFDEEQLKKVLGVIRCLTTVFESFVFQLKRLNDNLEKRKDG